MSINFGVSGYILSSERILKIEKQISKTSVAQILFMHITFIETAKLVIRLLDIHFMIGIDVELMFSLVTNWKRR